MQRLDDAKTDGKEIFGLNNGYEIWHSFTTNRQSI